MRDVHELDAIFQDILSGLSAAGIQRTAMSVGKAIRQVQTNASEARYPRTVSPGRNENAGYCAYKKA